MVEVFNWKDNEVKEMLSQLIIAQKLIPILGSGFTRGCTAKNGKVPSGDDMSNYMRTFLAQYYGKTPEYYKNNQFSQLCTLYNKRCSDKEKFDYFSNNFTEVIIEPEKENFLKIFSQYIYTFNIDDGIENNCKEYKVLLPNMDIFDEYIESYKSVFKLHGDVHYYLKNIKNEHLIFDKKEYIESIRKNGKMLAKLKEDFADKNIMYLGCSLDDEPDLLSIVSEAVKMRRAECKSYYITKHELDEEKMDLLEEYGVTTILQIEDYKSFYEELFSICNPKSKSDDFLSLYYEPKINSLIKNDTTIENILNSKKIVKSPFDGIIEKPYFFISRTIVDSIINDLKFITPIHIIYGSRISGKTFCLVNLMELVVDKTKYFFPANVKISDDMLSKLLDSNNSLFVFDTNTLSDIQIQKILNFTRALKEKNNYLIITFNSSDRNGVDLITPTNKYKFTKIKNVFDDEEIRLLNQKLQKNNIPTFINKEIIRTKRRSISVSRTILDNLYILAEKFPNESKLPKSFEFEQNMSTKLLSLLIILATNSELSSFDLMYFDIRPEADYLIKKYPIHFEMNYYKESYLFIDSSYKLSTNSRYFLLKYLGDYAVDENHYNIILEAYKYIYSRLELNEDNFMVSRKMLTYIKFDVLNDVFYRNNNTIIKLIKYLYEELEEEMNVNPQFKHQRAKSIIWLCSNDIVSMLEAETYINLARHDVENILKTKNNEKLYISLEHIKYTQASIYGRICKLQDYSNLQYNISAIKYYYEALTSECNKLELEDLRSRKTEKYIYGDLFSIIKYVKNNECKFDNNVINISKKLEDLLH